MFVEGEEEIGSPTLAQLLEQHHDELAADVFVITDSTNWAVGEPAFTTSLRGLAGFTVEVRTLDHGLHSGVYGGVVPDALTTLCRLLATLHDDHGNVAVAGLGTDSSSGAGVSARAVAGGVRDSGWRRVDRHRVACRADVVQAIDLGDRPRRDSGRSGLQHA